MRLQRRSPIDLALAALRAQEASRTWGGLWINNLPGLSLNERSRKNRPSEKRLLKNDQFLSNLKIVVLEDWRFSGNARVHRVGVIAKPRDRAIQITESNEEMSGLSVFGLGWRRVAL
ncbi:hypothetical protein [Schauerella aestuarii]|uniref:hypothetical protein n=1 Tax=Schauerella aestuarii TaxID=2511204 RepID=UPI00136D7A37|nr:hypothetical protein [Achromobacter aestuarii]MYZ41963.1 hypothetical protein [Achromobacter aestuarii]